MQIRNCCTVRYIVAIAVVFACFTSAGSADQYQTTEEQKVTDNSASASPKVEQPKPPISAQTGIASWYGGSFVGRRTASGERYLPNERTAAHKKLPFGTYVRVINPRNKRSAIVRINNRGPYTKGRIIDLSKQAATDLGMVNAGTARVRVEVLAKEVAVAELASLDASKLNTVPVRDEPLEVVAAQKTVSE